MRRLLFILAGSCALSACDSAGTALDDTVRLAAVEQCRQISEGAGIAAGAVSEVCGCAADKWLERPVAERARIDRAAIESIINDCAGTDRKSDIPASSETY